MDQNPTKGESKQSIIWTMSIKNLYESVHCFLEAIERGDHPPDCELRRGDDLQELCQLLNRVTRPWRAPVTRGAESNETSQAA